MTRQEEFLADLEELFIRYDVCIDVVGHDKIHFYADQGTCRPVIYSDVDKERLSLAATHLELG